MKEKNKKLKRVNTSAWERCAGEASRAEWRAAAGRRKDVAGIEEGIDRAATTAVLRGGRRTACAHGILCTVIAGGSWTRDRLFRCMVVSSAVCPYCDSGEVETQEHRYWTCIAWQTVRERHTMAVKAQRDDWPQCLICCGVMPAGLPAPQQQPLTTLLLLHTPAPLLLVPQWCS